MKSNYFLSMVLFASFVLIISCNRGKIEQLRLIPVKSGQLFQYIDPNGKIVINPQFADASIFRDGLARVMVDGERSLFGYITPSGNFEINAQYIFASDFHEGFAWVMSDNDSPPTVINKKGEFIFSMPDARRFRIFSEGLAAYAIADDQGNYLWGFVDKNGKIIINPQFASVGFFQEKKCAVMNTDGRWGYIGNEGKLIINHQFDNALGFEKGKAIVNMGGQFGVIDKDGKFVFNPQFSSIISDGDSYLIEQNGKWGWCDKNGKMFINPQFNRAFPFFKYNLAPVESNGKFGYIDKSGKLVINPQFDEAYPFNGKTALIKSSGKYGFINTQGLFEINPQFEDVSISLINFLTAPNQVNVSDIIDKRILQVNRLVEKNLSRQYDIWSVYLEAGKNYQIDMMSDEFDTEIVLFDDRENFIDYNDDGGSNTNSRLRFSPNTTGTYIIFAASHGLGSGKYLIQFRER